MSASSGGGSIAEALASLPKPGDVIASKYRVESVIGAGGMGVVLGATDTTLGRRVAIKFLAPDRVSREDAQARFLREARAAASMQSEHVVRVFEVDTWHGAAGIPAASGVPFIVMEHLHGRDLGAELTARGGLPVDEAVDYVLQVCEALGEAHARGIVHRDLKPQNLFLTRRLDGSPCVKVLDFGISKAMEVGSQDLTATDVVMGTPLYMSPEQVRSLKSVDHRSDIWALGVILFELLTSSPVYEAPTAAALCAMIATDPPTPLRTRRPQAPAELEAIVTRCLAKDPAQRFRDVAELSMALAPFASARGRASAPRVARLVGQAGAMAPTSALSAQMPASQNPTAGGGAAPHAPPALQLATFGTAPTVSQSHALPARHAGLVPSALPPPFSGPPPVAPAFSHPPQGMVPGPAQTGGTSRFPSVALLVVATMVLGTAVVIVVAPDGDRSAAVVDASLAPSATATGAGAMTSLSSTATSAPTPSSAPTSTSSGGKPKPAPGPETIKDAGAPNKTDVKDAGASPNNDEAERNATLGRTAQLQCDNHTRQMTTFARDDASRKRAAQQAKSFMCRGMVSSRCERQVCREACMVLGDQACIQQITYVIDHGPAPKY